MMFSKSKLCFIIILFVPLLLKGEVSNNIDSLKQVIQTGCTTDRIGALITLSRIHADSAHTLTIELAQEALRLSEKINDKKQIASSYNQLGYAYSMCSFDDKALQYDKKALSIYEETSDTMNVLSMLNRIGADYKEIGEYQTGIDYHIKAVRIYEERKDSLNMAMCYHGIASVYKEMGDCESCLKYFTLSYQLVKQINHPYGKGIVALSMGDTHYSMEEYDKSEKYLLEAIKSARAVNDLGTLACSYGSYSEVLSAKKKYIEALRYLGKSSEIINKIHFNDKLATVELTYGKIYREMGKWQEATKHLQKSIDLARQYNNVDELKLAYKELETVYAELNNYKQSYKYNKLYHQLKDSLFNGETKTRIAHIQTIYETEKKEHENEVLRIKNKKQKVVQYFLVSTIFIVFILAVFLMLYFNQRRKTAIQKKLVVEKESENLKNKLEFRNKELTTNAIYLARTESMISEVVDELKNIDTGLDEESNKTVKNIIRKLNGKRSAESWRNFEYHFEQVYNSFYENLSKQHPALSPAEKKLAAFLKLNMTTKDIAALTHQTPRSIETSRYRLRKKLKINQDENLVLYLSGF